MLSRDDLERELRRLRVQTHPAEFGAAVRDLAAVHSRGKERMRDILESLLTQDAEHLAEVFAELKAEGRIPNRKRGPAAKDDPAWLLAMLRHSGRRQSDFLTDYAEARARSDGGPDPYARLEKAISQAKVAYQSDGEFRARVDSFVDLLADATGTFTNNSP